MSNLTEQERDLAGNFGPPVLADVRVNPESFWRHTTRGRDAEVCMVLRRSSGRLLVFRKTFYPPGVFRLLTGGIEAGETILDALRREAWEETGLDVHIERYLGRVRYRAEDGDRIWFHTHAFLLREVGGTLGALDPDERVEEFREVDVDALPGIAATLDGMDDLYSGDLEQHWSHWGRYRAVATRIVDQAMPGVPGE